MLLNREKQQLEENFVRKTHSIWNTVVDNAEVGNFQFSIHLGLKITYQLKLTIRLPFSYSPQVIFN